MKLQSIKTWIWRIAPRQLKLAYRKFIKGEEFNYQSANKWVKTLEGKSVHGWVNPQDIKYIIWQSDLTGNLKKMKGCTVVAGDWDIPKICFEDSEDYKSFYDHFIRKTPWENTDYYARLKEGHFSKRVKKKGSVENFLNGYDDIYEKIKSEGFKELYPIVLLIGRNGELIRYDGSHRTTIAKILGVSLIPVQIKLIHKKALKKEFKNPFITRDFNKYPAIVISGRGKTKLKIEKWNESFKKMIKVDFFPGSLNLILHQPVLLKQSKAYKYAKKYLLWEGLLNEIPVYFLRWNNCPLHVIEVLSQYNLREHLNLKDRSVVNIKVNSDYISNLTFSKKASWWILWKKRERLYYFSDYYWDILRKKIPLKKLNQLSSQSSIVKRKSSI